MATHEAGWRSAKTRYKWTATLKTFAYPFIGRAPVDSITTDDVMKILSPIWATKNETASRVRGRIDPRRREGRRLQNRREPGPLGRASRASAAAS
jgi:hypothetical protein